ncbi:multiple inositol polyphosphate phosphatase 1-like [Prorops nasuta]|uniref:multiple inositol polyphosphate phosphatase 1-like n=1 Tax=Prorops nasuta TaxID=863751 RepID=UPI0034CD8D1A
MYVFFLLALVTLHHVGARDVDYCFAQEEDPYLLMGTKTAYDFVRSGRTGYQSVPNCEPLQVWMTSVHGTSYPTPSEINGLLNLTEIRNHIIHNHENRGNGRLCNNDLEYLKRWNYNPYVTSSADSLTRQGYEDMKLLARRIQSGFRELLQPVSAEINSMNYKLKAAQGQTTQSSMESFMEGLFGSPNAVVPEMSPVNDTLLSTHKRCTVWNENSDGNDFDNEQRKQFDDGQEFQNLLQNVSRRLGFLYGLSKDSILAMYDMCRYEKSWQITRLSTWCAVFSKDELRLLEYREDLNYYYIGGYGRDINNRLGCPLVQDMMSHFRSLEEGRVTREPRGIFYFTDVISFQNLLTSLEVAKDDMPLLYHNYRQMVRRQWRTSLISPFAANIAAVFYKCRDNGLSYKVMFYLNEGPVRFRNCDVGLCDWQYLKGKFAHLWDCGLNACWDKNGVATIHTGHFLTFSLTMFLLTRFFLH